ncbi:MAG: fumarylacetoacetate hydrolase family protein, partial [Halomonas sp.]|nr:fumarylacetoacetate hydrolase family protein [Halomonas sp.]
VDALALAWREGRPLTAQTARRLAPEGPDHAYAIQAALGERLGWWPMGRPHGWKLAMGHPPKAAPIPDGRYQLSPARMRDPVSVAGIEVELAVRLSRPLLAGASREEAEAAVGETLAVIEGFDVRAEHWRELPPAFLLADLQMHGGLVIGSGVSGWAGDTRLSLEVTDQEPAPGNWQHPLGDPLALLPWLAEHAASRGWPLQPGDLVATGSWCGMLELPPGGRLVASFEGVGEVALQRAAEPDDMR